MILFAILVFIFILGLLIFVHELGHFVVAKRAGMKVEEFGFGFPPRLFGIRRGETIYSVNWIPLGGFVKITGEDGQSDDPRAFSNKGFGARFSVLVAGVSMNLILGFVILLVGFWLVGTPAEIGPDLLYASQARIHNQQITIISVQEHSPAETAGFKLGDTVLSLDGRHFGSIPEMIDYTKSRAGSVVRYELKRGKETFVRGAVPRVNPGPEEGTVGFIPAEIGNVTYPFPEAISAAASYFFIKTTSIFFAFGLLIKDFFTKGQLVQGLSGPVGIAFLTRDFVRLGIIYLLQFTATLTINLGVINAFPFPALDGGRVLFLFLEKLRGARSKTWERHANLIGFVLLILLMFAVTFRDVSHYSAQFRHLFEKIF